LSVHRALVAALALAATGTGAAQEPPARLPPTFSAAAEAITVDVVVLGRDGHPVTDLRREDFTLREDGRAQELVAFESRALLRAGGAEAAADGAGAASNEVAPAPGGRTLAFIVDDLGIEPLQMTEVTGSIARWLQDGAHPRDQVTLLTSSGDAWWSDSAGPGRLDLLAVLRRMKGRKPLPGGENMTDWEAYSIDTLASPLEAVEEDPADGPPGTGQPTCTRDDPSSSVRDRVIDRYFRNNLCPCDTAAPRTIINSIKSCRGIVSARARQVYEGARGRAVGLLGAIERLSSGLSGARGRKSVVVLSSGLLRDADQRAYERAVDASRRGNTAVSFVDVRGLIGMPMFGAEQRQAGKGGDMGSRIMETTLLETAGGEDMARTTGGSMVRNTNDLAGSVKRLADEAAAYYLLGYQSDRPLDGRWRTLSVKVARPGLTVRARRGFFATAAPPVLAAVGGGRKEKRKDGTLPARAIDPALAAGGDRDGIPLRAAAHVLETDAARTTRILVALEVGTAALSFAGSGSERTAELDVTVLGVSRDQPKTVPVDVHLSLGVDARAVGGWYVFSRELRLPPGPAQVRAFVRDTASGRSGLVTQRIEVPRGDRPYISTPILSDRTLRMPGRAEPRIVVAAHRTFAPRGRLSCTYEVYPAPGSGLNQVPHILGSYRLEDALGRQVSAGEPTPIGMALDARFVRTIELPLDRLAPGHYRLTVEATDKANGLSLHAQETFTIEPPAQAAVEPAARP
jgi:VWFA-related protein